jgi:hypothetical protein
MLAPTPAEMEASAAKEKERRKKRAEYENQFTTKHLNTFTKIYETSICAAMAYVLGLIVKHLLTHDSTHMSKCEHTHIDLMRF